MSKPPSAGPLTEKQARKRIEDEKGFYGNVAAYLVVNTFLIAINLITDPSYFWAIWPLLGWGTGVAGHAFSVFGLPGIGRSWEERRLRALTGQDTEEATDARLRRLLDTELGERNRFASDAPSEERLQRRIEHLEAIVTSRDWDLLDVPPPAPRLPLENASHTEETPAAESPEARAARLARRVR